MNVSDFMMAGVIVPRNDGEGCCIDGAANWVFASAHELAPVNSHTLSIVTGTFLFLNWPFFDLSQNPFTNGYNINTELGEVNDILCEGFQQLEKTENFVEHRQLSGSHKNKVISLINTAGIQIMDLSNRNVSELNDIKKELRLNTNNIPEGMYIINYIEDGITKSKKIFIGR